MLKHLLVLSLLLTASFAQAAEYGHYDPKRLLSVSETASGKHYRFNLGYLDQVLRDLSAHARNYPPRFDSPQGRQRAVEDVKRFARMLDILVNTPRPNTQILARAGYLNSIGYNLDVPGSGEKAIAIFEKLLAATPSDPRANYLYGSFLANAQKPRQALPYLEKAYAGGMADAAYTIGMAYLSLGNREKGLEHLEIYKRRNPDDTRVGRLIEAIRAGKIRSGKS
ncbi:MAG: tetratricopeptide repeat protein [Acidihalobacter sp.]